MSCQYVFITRLIIIAAAAVIVAVTYYKLYLPVNPVFSSILFKNNLRPFFTIWCGSACVAGFVSDEYYNLWKYLENEYGWKEVADLSSQNRTWFSNDTIRSYFHRYFNQIPDLILYNHVFETARYHSTLKDWELIRHPWFFIEDIHAWTENDRVLKKSAMVPMENIVTAFPYKLDEVYCRTSPQGPPQWFSFHRTWLPHSASPSFHLPYNRNPKMKIFLSGAITSFYPYREIFLEMHKKMPVGAPNNTIIYHPHPGYAPLNNQTRLSAHEAYGRMINTYFAAVTSTSIMNYVLAKIFEIPAAGALLIVNSEAIPMLARLRLYENVHYVAYNKTNIELIFSDVLSARSFEKYEKIRWTAHQTIMEYHTTDRRALFLHNLAMNNYIHSTPKSIAP
ncbi:unnamed protein product [Adineta ricciae]|uniref:Uncharacterized protein n=1 Tax=Adineta ricciae TaxID=249248 RepID=A0A816FEU1_ADIRI|nr:unnamed protein product [Adineta ricciae]CAF1660625.1 unnamed protein product [Adineta ricciae]